jgi:SAM-dependent methyltransferase
MLSMQYTRKPGKYWCDFAHVEAELLAFIEEHGTPGIMPIEKELLQAGRGDLAKAIRKHKGVEAVAQRLGLQLPSHKRKRHGYWEDFANVTFELLNFIAEHGTPGVMPKQNELTQTGCHSLAVAIDRHGGVFTVAQRLGLQLSHAQHPDGYWDDFATIERKLFAYIEKHGTQGVMPSRAELIKAGLGDLAGAFDKYGGSSAAAERLGLRMKIKPMGHWDDFTNVERALSAYIEAYGTTGVMPTASGLQKAGQNSLVIAITKKHGGMACTAERLGLQLSSTAKPPNYWDNIAHIELAIREFNETRGMPGVMPTGGELKKAGRSDLASAITNRGGFPAIAEQLGLTFTYTAKPDRYWDDFANVQQEVFDFIQAQGIWGIMPTSSELQKAGKHSLSAAISSKHGGFPVVAERLGLTATKKPHGYWDDFANFEQELLTFIQEHGQQGVMPTHQEFYGAKRSDLSFAIAKHGGVATVRQRLGLHAPSKRPGPWDDFSRVEQELHVFVVTQGIAGVMPTREQLKQAGRRDLIAAIDTHGGSFAVAQRLQLQLTSGNRPNGYWDDFTRVEEAIIRFLITSHTSGTMPTLAQLNQAGQGDLAAAISRHGGIGAVAHSLDLQLGSSNRPNGYWNDFSHVEQELRSFIEEQGTSGIMPTAAQLEDAGYGNLLHGIAKHGGMAAIARRLGLQLSSTAKPSGYWNDFAHVEQELHQYIQEQGIPEVMPTQSELSKAGRQDLINAIRKTHGGFTAVAQRLGLQQRVFGKQPGYWKDFANVERELRLWIANYGSPDMMSALQTLRQNGQTALASAIAQQGGFPAVAQRLGLTYTYTAKPAGYWNDFSHIEQAVNAFIEEHGTPGIMPTRGELRNAGWHDLEIALGKHGGSPAIAKRLGLQLSYSKRELGYWHDFANVQRELLEFIRKSGIDGAMPTRDELHAARLSGLSDAIIKHGGFVAVATRLGLAYTATKPNGYWDDFANLERELLVFIQMHGVEGVMPTAIVIAKAKQSSLVMGVNKHGGFSTIANRLGLTYTSHKPGGYWKDFSHVEQELLAFIQNQGTPGKMPTYEALERANLNSLAIAIGKFGGASVVARRLGLEYYGPESITAEMATRVERLARSIQPLAESNLLSGAQVMIIQRRAGMLDYRNSRITRLNANLAHGNHDAIELALAQLRKTPEEEIAVPLVDEETLLQQELADTGLEGVAGSNLPVEEDSSFPSADPTHTIPDLHQEQVAIRGLSALGAIRLPLDEILGLLTSKILWEAFYKRLYIWYGSLHSTQIVTTDDVQAAILSAYAGQMDNEFVLEAAAKFTQEVEQAVNFATRLAQYGWTGPHLRLHQADAARRMADILIKKEHSAFLLDADDPGMGKSASFLAAAAVSGIRRIILLAPKTVADDTWADPYGEIRKCLAHVSIVRGLRETLDATSLPSGTSPVFFVLHYEELLNDEMMDRLTSEQFDCLCIDEVHLVKQRGGQQETYRREALVKTRAAAQSAIGLTGTPLVNELAEPLSLLQILSNQDRQFDYTRLSNHRMGDIADVFEAILPHIVRRRKKDVLLHLPLYDIRPVEMPLQDDLLEQIRTIGMWPRAQANNALAQLRKIALEAKLPSIRKRAESARKLLVLTYLRDEVSEAIYADLQDFFPGQVGQINGAIAKEQRKAILDAFRAPNGLRILVGTIGTIGVGLTLFDPTQEQTAHEIIVADLPYTAAEFDQGIARLHREGQKSRVVVDVLLTTTNALLHDGSLLRTIDQRIWDLILSKRELSDVAIDGMYSTTDAAKKVRKALHRWLKQIRETGLEPLVAEQRPAELSAAQKWRGEIARLRGISAAKADELFASTEYTRAFLDHLRTSPASQLAYQWLRAKLEYLLRPDLRIIDMGCGLNPFAELPCHVTGLDRHGLPDQVKGKMEKPPLPDASADVMIYSLSLYGTADDLRAYFTHARRILRGGGHLFIVEPGSTFTPEGLIHFIDDLQRFGFEQVGNVREIRGEDDIVLKGMHFTLTGDMGKPEETTFERK